MSRIATLITCHNRKAKTLACLTALFNNVLPDGYALEVFLVDDGSSDGTAPFVQEHFPLVNIIKGNGSLYWNGGMRMAFAVALEKDFDYYLWLNDDTLLYPDSVSRALTTASSFPVGDISVAVGTMQAHQGGAPTYGGLIRIGSGLSYKSRLVVPELVPIECQQMNGNCVLIPRAIATRVGNLDKYFIHNLGDIDYGMRVRAAGFKLMVLPGFAGICDRNSTAGSHLDKRMGFRLRLKDVLSVKAFPVLPWFVFTWRHAGHLWFLYWLKPYIDVVFSSFRSK